MNRKGEAGEETARKFLEKKGYRVVSANYRSRFGEIDIIVQNEKYIVFVEVKARSEGAIARPMEFVDVPKQKRIIKTALLFLSSHPTPLQPRFDVVEVYGQGRKPVVNHLENAFGTEGGYAAF